VRNAFAKAGVSHAIVEARNGQQAVNYLSGSGLYADRGKHPLPDLVLLDLRMPLMDGFEFLGWLKTRGDLGWLPVVVLSASDLPADMERARKLGAQDYLVKPSEWEDLVKVVQELHDKWITKASRDRGSRSKVHSLKAEAQSEQPELEQPRPRA
jgi:CheY-like chemotaxis protein